MTLNRLLLQRISAQRRREAATLFKSGHFPGAYYLTGYAIECAIKACIAKQTRRHDFPDKAIAPKVFTHNLELLMRLAGLEQDLAKDLKANPTLEINWAITKDWSEEARYDVAITKAQARDLYSACTSRTHGVLTWVRKRW